MRCTKRPRTIAVHPVEGIHSSFKGASARRSCHPVAVTFRRGFAKKEDRFPQTAQPWDATRSARRLASRQTRIVCEGGCDRFAQQLAQKRSPTPSRDCSKRPNKNHAVPPASGTQLLADCATYNRAQRT